MKLLIAILTMVLFTAASTAFADSRNYGPYPAYYSEECGSCHVPYPAQLLTQAGWETQINGLKNHFGTDASIDVPASQTILSYLVNNAAWKTKYAPTDSAARVTKTNWFIKEHLKISSKEKGFSNCTQCHEQAVQGDYSQHKHSLPASWQNIN